MLALDLNSLDRLQINLSVEVTKTRADLPLSNLRRRNAELHWKLLTATYRMAREFYLQRHQKKTDAELTITIDK